MLKPIQFDSAALAAAMASAPVEVVAPVLNAKQEKELEVQRILDRKQAAQEAAYARGRTPDYDTRAAEHNAENRRYDNEGVYYIGGKEVITRYGY